MRLLHTGERLPTTDRNLIGCPTIMSKASPAVQSYLGGAELNLRQTLAIFRTLDLMEIVDLVGNGGFNSSDTFHPRARGVIAGDDMQTWDKG